MKKKNSDIWIFIFFILGLGWGFIGGSVQAHVPDTEAAEKATWSCITNADKFPEVSKVTLSHVCAIVSGMGRKTFTITSGCRTLKSWHHRGRNGVCMAVDGYFDTYTGSTLADNAVKYVDDLHALSQFHVNSDYYKKYCRVGTYPPHFCNGVEKSNGLIFHIDMAGKGNGGTWARICGRYVGIIQGLQVFRDYLLEKEGENLTGLEEFFYNLEMEDGLPVIRSLDQKVGGWPTPSSNNAPDWPE